MIQLRNRATGEIVDMYKNALYTDGVEIYKIKHTGCGVCNCEDVSLQYSILTGTRSREEIEEEIKHLKFVQKDYITNEDMFKQMFYKIQSLEWVLKEEDKTNGKLGNK